MRKIIFCQVFQKDQSKERTATIEFKLKKENPEVAGEICLKEAKKMLQVTGKLFIGLYWKMLC